ncbi:PTS sugar transporter subunit IIA [Erysipelothrix sp. D19-032]
MVSEHFKQSVLDREKMSSTSFIYAIAIPHPLDLESHQSKVAVAPLKKPIRWGSYDVKLVMLLAITEEDSAKMWLFFDWLSKPLQVLKRCRNYCNQKIEMNLFIG